MWLCIRHTLRELFSNRRLAPEMSYMSFYCEDYRYARIASNPTENRRIENRVRYDRALEQGRTGKYGLIRPRILMQTQGDRSPIAVRDFPVSALHQPWSFGPHSLTDLSQPNVRYLFIAFSFNHFPDSNMERKIELVRVANKVTQQLGFSYFWISISCMEITVQDAATPEEWKKVEESDVRLLKSEIHNSFSI
jgi:hypothetical protein